jgi:hypothetical protein
MTPPTTPDAPAHAGRTALGSQHHSTADGVPERLLHHANNANHAKQANRATDASHAPRHPGRTATQ